MKRTKESLKNNLIGVFNNQSNPNKVIATRGSNSLLSKTKKPTYSYSKYNWIGFFVGWIILSIILWLTLFTSLTSLFALITFGSILLFIIKFFVPTQNHQVVTEHRSKETIETAILESKDFLTNEIILVLENIIQNCNYLTPFFDKSSLSVSQEHYIKSCQEKHVIQILSYIKSTHQENLEKSQIKALEQLKIINNNLRNIISEVQSVIELQIDIKKAFKPD